MKKEEEQLKKFKIDLARLIVKYKLCFDFMDYRDCPIYLCESCSDCKYIQADWDGFLAWEIDTEIKKILKGGKK